MTLNELCSKKINDVVAEMEVISMEVKPNPDGTIEHIILKYVPKVEESK